MKTYQLVLPPTAPELPCVHKFTRDASVLGNAPLQTVILVTTMEDAVYEALPTDKIYS